MPKEGVVIAKIRVFYPNPLPYSPLGAMSGLDTISKEYNVTYIFKLDPIYHELCFADDQGVRHNIIGLAYHMTENLEEANGISGIV